MRLRRLEPILATSTFGTWPEAQDRPSCDSQFQAADSTQAATDAAMPAIAGLRERYDVGIRSNDCSDGSTQSHGNARTW